MVDETLLKQVINHDKHAFKLLFDLYKRRVYQTSFLILKDCQLADDIVQETFLQVFLKLHKLSNLMAFEKWLYKINLNLCFKAIREKQKTEILFIDDELENNLSIEEFSVPENIILKREFQKNIMEAVDSLPVKQRAVLVLFYFNDFCIKEIGEIMNCSEGTVKSRLFYGKKILRDTLMEEQKDCLKDITGGLFYEA